jgi:hypothetical protein
MASFGGVIATYWAGLRDEWNVSIDIALFLVVIIPFLSEHRDNFFTVICILTGRSAIRLQTALSTK